MQTISIVIIAFNEAAKIEACLKSVTWADEIIIVDSGSTDETCQIAKNYTQKVIHNPWPGYGPQKQFASQQATGDWTLSLDADERVSAELADEIRHMLAQNNPSINAYRVPIVDWMFGVVPKYGSWAHQAHTRLYRTGSITWEGQVHEQTHIHGNISALTHPIFHYSHTSVERFLFKLNKYTDLEAQAMFDSQQRVGLAGALLKSARAFTGQYFRLQGFRDGGHGLILALMMAFYEFIKHAKTWVLWFQHDHPAAQRPPWE